MVKEENESSREREDKEEIDFQNSIKDLVCVYTMSWKRDYFKLERFMQKQKTKMIWIIVVLRNVNKEEWLNKYLTLSSIGINDDRLIMKQILTSLSVMRLSICEIWNIFPIIKFAH